MLWSGWYLTPLISCSSWFFSSALGTISKVPIRTEILPSFCETYPKRRNQPISFYVIETERFISASFFCFLLMDALTKSMAPSFLVLYQYFFFSDMIYQDLGIYHVMSERHGLWFPAKRGLCALLRRLPCTYTMSILVICKSSGILLLFISLTLIVLYFQLVNVCFGVNDT